MQNWRRRQLLLDSQTHRLLANVDGNGIFASTDAGMTWTPSTTGLPAGADIRDVVVNPSDSSIYYSLVAGSGSNPASVYRSADRGASWAKVSDASLRAYDVFQLALAASDPRRLYLAARQT